MYKWIIINIPRYYGNSPLIFFIYLKSPGLLTWPVRIWAWPVRIWRVSTGQGSYTAQVKPQKCHHNVMNSIKHSDLAKWFSAGCWSQAGQWRIEIATDLPGFNSEQRQPLGQMARVSTFEQIFWAAFFTGELSRLLPIGKDIKEWAESWGVM